MFDVEYHLREITMVFLHGKYQIYKGKEVKSAGGREIEREWDFVREREMTPLRSILISYRVRNANYVNALNLTIGP